MSKPYCFLDSVNRIDNGIIMAGTNAYFSALELMNLRLVSGAFRDSIDMLPCVNDALVYSVNGWSPSYAVLNRFQEKVHPVINTLLAGTFRWFHIKLSNMDAGEDLFRQMDLFKSFKEICKNLKSITLENVTCKMEHVIEMVAACPRLIELNITNCPALFTTGMQILNYLQFMDGFHRRLANLKCFKIIDSRPNASVLTLPTIQGWTAVMNHLVTLNLRVPPEGSGQLPITYLTKILTQNQNTLRHLSLVGKCGFDYSVQGALENLQLTSLCLGGIRIYPASSILGNVLRHQEKLEVLHLFQMDINCCVFPILGKHVKNLKRLAFEHVTYKGVPDVEQLNSIPSMTELSILGWQNDSKEANQWLPLFKKQAAFSLSTLSLRVNKAFVLLQGQVLTTLKSLHIYGVETVDDENFDQFESLIRRVMRMPQLEMLQIKGTTLDDVHFPAIEEQPGSKAMSRFCSLVNLGYLDLSKSMIGDETLLGHIIYLPNLQFLMISETQVTIRWLRVVLKHRKRGDVAVLPKIRNISALNCPSLLIIKRWVKHIEKVLSAQLICDIHIRRRKKGVIGRGEGEFHRIRSEMGVAAQGGFVNVNLPN